MKPMRKNKWLTILTQALYDLPTSVNLNYFYNYGSLLSVCLVLQVVTGFFLATHYVSDINLAFDSIAHISRDMSYGWCVRLMHANGASFFFLCMYIHVGRGLYYSSYRNQNAWFSGIIIFVMSILIAFLGYVLVWGQMSYWAATVITNLLSILPYIGKTVVEWLWGGFAIGAPTLTRFYALHFISPFILLFLVSLHIMFLHNKLTTGPSGVKNWDDMSWFHPYYTTSDCYTMVIMIFMMFMSLGLFPYALLDPENFQEANSMVTPEHILPEWYFLPFYAILRSIPSKAWGIIALLMSLCILFLLPFLTMTFCRSFSPWHKSWFWVFVVNFMFLGFIGMVPVEDPYTWLGLCSSILYYFFMLICHL